MAKRPNFVKYSSPRVIAIRELTFWDDFKYKTVY